MQDLTLQEQLNLPLVQNLMVQLDNRGQAQLNTKISAAKIENIKVPYIIKNRLLMKAGEFNGVVYPKEEIISKVDEANGASIVLDHLDTQNQGTTAWVGQIENTRWDVGDKGEGLYGDLAILDKPIAQKLAYGAKWGISPTIDYEKNELTGKTIGTDLHWKSFSFVVTPAVRATMLNFEQEASTMEENNRAVDTLAAPKDKYPYKYPKKDEKEMNVSEEVKELLEQKDTELEELRKFKKKKEEEEKDELADGLVANEFLIGRLSELELAERHKTLMEKSTEVLTELGEVIGDHAELLSYRQFVKDFMKKTKGATIGDAAKAWKKRGKKKLEEETPAEPAEEGGDKEDAPAEEPEKKEEASLISQSAVKKEQAELSKNPVVTNADKEFYNHLVKDVQGGISI